MAIVESVMNLLTRQVTSSLAERLGASASDVQMGIGSSVAALLAGIASRARDSGFVSQVFQLVKTVDTPNILDSLPNLASGAGASSPAMELGSKLSSLLLRGQQSHVEDLIGHQSGLAAGAGRELMSLAAPLTAGFLGHEIRDTGLTPSAFAEMIRHEAAKIQGFLPLGFPRALSPVSIPATFPTAEATAGEGIGRKVGYTLMGLLLLALIAWLVSRGWSNPEPAPAAPAVEVGPATPALGLLGEFIQRKLPDGTVLNIPSLGIENRLLDFIEDRSRPVDRTTWFDFDRLTFDTGKATLQDSSTEQLQNIAAILKAYPKVKVKIGGYTDNTGDKEANLRLAQDRATNVMHEWVQDGVDSSRLAAEGYGEEHAVGDNSTFEGRQTNRRIALRVTAK
jgi:outer membrane protein OmpA-like peptidoglycan-associated protein